MDCDDCAKHFSDEQTRPDYIAICEYPDGLHVAVIECKSGDFRIDRIHKQLQAGADVAAGWLQKHQHEVFRPVLMCVTQGHGNELNKLLTNKYRVMFRGERHLIRRHTCGDSLDTMLPRNVGGDRRQRGN